MDRKKDGWVGIKPGLRTAMSSQKIYFASCPANLNWERKSKCERPSLAC